MVHWRIVEALHCAVQKRIKKTNRRPVMSIPSFCPRRSCFVLCPSGVSDSPMVWRTARTCITSPFYSWYEISLYKTCKVVSPREFWRLRKIHSSTCKSWWRELGHFGIARTRLLDALMHRRDRRSNSTKVSEIWEFEITTPRYSGTLSSTLSSTLRFECTSDTSTSHKQQEAKWDRCGGERVVFSMPLCHAFHDSVRTLRFMAFRLVSQTVSDDIHNATSFE